MKKIPFKIGSSGYIKSRVGFGCWGLGSGSKENPSYGNITLPKALDLLEYSLKKKMNFFDTSPAYGCSEKILGIFIKNKKRNEVVISSKCGISNFKKKPDFSEDFIRKQIAKSLKVIDTDYIDLLQLHNPPVKYLKRINDFFFLKKDFTSEIKSFGISLNKPDDFFFINDLSFIDFIQVNFNLLDIRVIEKEIIQKCKENKIEIIARTPFAFGFMTGKYRYDHNFLDSDHRTLWSLNDKKKWIENSKEIFKQVLTKKKIDPSSIMFEFLSFVS